MRLQALLVGTATEQLAIQLLIEYFASKGMSKTIDDFVAKANETGLSRVGATEAGIVLLGGLASLVESGGAVLYSDNWGVGNPPSITPMTSVALAINKSDGTLWKWYDGAWH